MKKAMKRTVALLILVCLTVAMIPAVFAGEASVYSVVT